MKKKIVLFILSLGFYTNAIAQLILTGNLTPQQLANGIAGQGITVMNATFTGDTSQAATFTASGTNLGITDGVMLATGTTSYAIGPNVGFGSGTDMGLPGDLLLDSLAGGNITFDACILEFDFVPQSTQVSFRYVFGSEEYPEFVCSGYNDVFCFFISGPGIAGTMNMALIPGTSSPVAINSVNGGAVGSNGFPGPHCGLGYSNLYVDNTAGATLELDGFTTPMTATAIVQPCGVYHLRIMIADAGDGVYDSGVFLEKGSLYSNPAVNAGTDQTFCSGGSAQLGSAPEPTYTYNWNPTTGLSSSNVSDPTVTLTNTGAAPATFAYVVIGNSGTCLFTDTVLVTVDPAPSVSFTITPSQVCEGQPMTVDYTGTAAANYIWDFGSATVLSGSGSGPYQIIYAAAMQDSISLTASNPGCSGSSGVNVTVNPNPVASFTMPPFACAGDDITISFTGNATAITQYTWDFTGGQITSGNGGGPFTVNWPTAGSPAVTLSISENGCVSPVVNSQILIAPFPIVFAGNDTTVCPDGNVLLGEATQPGYQYQWTPQTGVNDPISSNPIAIIANTGTTPVLNNYSVTITSPQGCSSTDDVAVTVDPAVNVDFITNGVFCLGANNVDFSVQGAYPATTAFRWDFGNLATPTASQLSFQQGVKFDTTGIFTVTLNATSDNCAMLPVSHTIEIFPEPQVDFIADNLSGCSPLNVNLANLSSDPTNSFLWTIGGSTTYTSTNSAITLTTPGQYDVALTATTSHGCSSGLLKSKYLNVYANPVAAFTTQPSIASIENPIIYFVNNSINAQTYQWNLGDSTTDIIRDITHIYNKVGTYEIMLIAISSQGCIDTTFGTIEINEGLSFYIPNSFSPNDDGINDYFQGYGINFVDFQMTIFNRWGEQVYKTDNYQKPWDGKISSSAQNEVYVYRILVTDKMKEQHTYVGSVTLVR